MKDLEWCVAVDVYVTETTRHADVILPPVSALERSDIDIVMPAVSIRNHVRYSPAAVPKPQDGREDWQILNELTRRLGSDLLKRPTAAAAKIGARLTNPERVIDLGLALGPYGTPAGALWRSVGPQAQAVAARHRPRSPRAASPRRAPDPS